jgi:predicted nucleic acid-binding protein
VSPWLIDKSALVRLSAATDADEWAGRIERGLVRISTVTRLEVGYSARSAADLLIAATTELSELAVLHMNKGFELIAELTDQRLQRLEMT